MTITKKKTKSGIKFYAQVCVNGQRPRATFSTLSEAARWEEETAALLRSGKPLAGEVASDDIYFKEASERAIKESNKKVSTGQLNNYRYAQAQFVKSFGEEATLGSITKADVAAHILKRMNEDGVGPSIIRTELAFLRSVYSKAQLWGFDYQSPELEIKRPKTKMKSREEALDRVIRPEELLALLNESQKRDNNLYQYLMVLLYTGMRPSEAAELYWQRLPVKEEKEAIKEGKPVGYVDLDRGGFSKVGTKTEPRFVPMHPRLVKLFERLKNENKLVFLPDKFIGTDRPYRYYRRTFGTTLKNAKLSNGERLREDIDFYSFRHTFRSTIEICGVSTAVAETIIGHQDRSFKFTYIHLSDQDLIREIAKLEYPILG